MKHEKPDPKLEKLVAALYGELTGEEERELVRLLEEDPALRAEFDELQGTRFLLTALETEEQETAAPSFVFLGETAPAARPRAAGFWARVKRGFERPGSGLAWGLAAAALLLAVLGLSGFRIQTVEGGVAFRFGEPEPQLASRPQTMEGLIQRTGEAAPLEAAPAAAQLTQTDLEDYETQVLRLMNAMLKDYSAYRDRELAGVIGAIYTDMSSRQDRVYEDLRGRIEAVNVGLSLQQARSDHRFDGILEQAEPVELTPVSGSEDNKQ